MPDPAAQLPVVYQTLARQAHTYPDVDPQTLAILDAAAADPAHAPPNYAQAIQRINQQHPEFNKTIPMSWWEKAIAIGGPAILTGGGALGWGAGGAGSSAAPAAATGGVLPSTSTIGMTALPAGSAGGSIAGGISAGGAAIPGGAAAAGTTAAASSPSWLKQLLSPNIVVGAGLGLAGALINAHEQGKATDAQAKAAEEAIALQREMYQQTRTDLAPYRQLGGSSSSSLGYLMGLPGYEGGPQPYVEPPPTPDTKTVIRAPLGSPVSVPTANITGTAVPRPGVTLVTLKRPDGQLISVNANLVDSYLQRGFTRV